MYIEIYRVRNIYMQKDEHNPGFAHKDTEFTLSLIIYICSNVGKGQLTK